MALSTCPVQQICCSCLPGEQQYLARGQQRPYLNCRINAIEISHDYVTDQHVGAQCFRGFYSFLSAVNCRCAESALIENDCQRVCDYALVIGDQDLGFNVIV